MRSKIVSLFAVAFGLGFAQAVSAADMPIKAPVAPAVIPFTWTGIYVGGNVGGLWSTKDWTIISGVPIGTNHPNGFIGGAQIGANWQTGAWVFGVQFDYDWSSADGNNADLLHVPSATDRTKIRSLGSATGRVGYAWNMMLLYVKGGAAWARDKYDVYENATGVGVRSASETRTGWTVGGGLEYALSPNWSIFGEYDYYGMGTKRITFDDSAQADIRQNISVAKVGFNYRFNWMH